MLKDGFGRVIEYLRVSVTDRCDLRCTYCMPQGFHDFLEPDHWLTIEEIERVVTAFARLGVGRVRLTGGEPLTRRGIVELATRLGHLDGIHDLSLSTNGTQLSRYATGLKNAGVSRLNVSLDSLDQGTYACIVGRNCLAQVLDGINTARQAGFDPIKINMVLQAGVNEHEAEPMVAYCMEHGFILRFIESMPVGDSGRSAKHIGLQELRQRLQQRFQLIPGLVPGGGPARYLQSADGNFSVGFITPISQHFCDTCNRVRLSADGTLYLCLGQEDKLALRPLLRAGASDEMLDAAIRQAISLKPERHEFDMAPQQIIRIMSQTGG